MLLCIGTILFLRLCAVLSSSLRIFNRQYAYLMQNEHWREHNPTFPIVADNVSDKPLCDD